MLAAIVIGGVVGAEARYMLGVAFPSGTGTWPWTTFAINVSGSVLLGCLYTVLADLVSDPHPLLRPLLGVGVVGGYTTFSTWSVETVSLVTTGHPLRAAVYALATPLIAVLACATAVAATRRIARCSAMHAREDS
ncbi:fluoride efflux transporter FluC [Pseudonocardia alni]|uniref:fluoride efflux transporter FluC n=1 Tax=Pseudonocardia alni TaxID=33907 RepID=UPI0033C31B31